MSERAGGTRSLPRRVLGKLGEFIGELVAEALLSVAVCAAAALAIGAGWWGWNRHPGATLAAGAMLAILIGHGAVTLHRERRGVVRPRGLFTRLAVAALSVLAAWLVLVLLYCDCT